MFDPPFLCTNRPLLKRGVNDVPALLSLYLHKSTLAPTELRCDSPNRRMPVPP